VFSGLVPEGAAILPGDSEFLPLLQAAVPAGARQMVFGETGDVRLLELHSGADASEMRAQVGDVQVRLRLNAPGRHMAMNALAVLAAVRALGLDVHRAAAALEGFSAFTGRGARRWVKLPEAGGKFLLLDESYNASPIAMRAALGVLALQPGRRVAVLGDMLELGEYAGREHLALLPEVRAGADVLFTCGASCRALFDSVGEAMQGAHAPDAATLAPKVRAALRDGDIVLVKGSLGSRMRDVIALLESPV
jgi:UDP-N-acetylmuramoyl-tripeptide--D-alanyl-D-alanine ligase